MRCVERFGAEKTSLADVAQELGITRQTIYRLFPGWEALQEAVALRAASAFVDRMTEHVEAIEDPVKALLECVAFTVEGLPREPSLSLVLLPDRRRQLSAAHLTTVASSLTLDLFGRLASDRPGANLDDPSDELVEIYLRTVQSLVQEPAPVRSPAELRGFLRLWLGPAVRACLAG